MYWELRYTLQHNDESFATSSNIVLQKGFIGILILSNYSKFFQIGMYWSTNSTLGSEIARQTMARNFFTKIKQYLNFQDNNNLDRNDKYTKIRKINKYK